MARAPTVAPEPDLLAVPGAEVWLAAAVHDLRDPLQSAYTYLKGIEDRFMDLLPLVAQKNVAAAIQAIHQSQELLEQSLACATAEEIDPDSVAMESVVEDIRSSLAADFERGGHSLEVRSLPNIRADPGGARRVMQHLIGNAVKHAEQPVKVTVSARRDRSGWWISVQDDGEGIPEAELEHIWEAKNPRSEGGGIGLALCHRIMNAHGGMLECESLMGEGTTMRVRWPDKPGRRTAAHRRLE